MRNPRIEFRQYGNNLQVIINIPWEEIHKPVPIPQGKKPDPTVWEHLKARVWAAYQDTGNVSAAAKQCRVVYYIAHEIIRAEIARERREKRQQIKDYALQLLASGEFARSVAAVVGKSERTLYRWMKDSGTAQQAELAVAILGEQR